MSRRYTRWAALLLAGVLPACNESVAPTTGTLQINVVTTGDDIDADGFLLSVGGAAAQVIPANGLSGVTTGPGSHELALSGLAFNCDVTAAPATASVTVGATTRVEVRASCSRYLANAIVYTTEQFGLPEVMVMRADGSRRERLTNDQAVYAAPVVAPDGQSIAAASRLGGSWNGIYLFDRFGKGRTKLVGRSTFDGAPAWSPDGMKLAFRSLLPGPYGEYGRVFVVNRDGGGLRQLTPETADYTFDDGPSWAPDGTRIVFSRSGDLFVINADGSGLTSLGVSGSYPAWSPDGTQIAYHAWLGSVTAVFVVGSDGASPRRVTTPVEGDQMPRWSADGRQLVFMRVEQGSFRLYKIGADGTGEAKLSVGTSSEAWASWSPVF